MNSAAPNVIGHPFAQHRRLNQTRAFECFVSGEQCRGVINELGNARDRIGRTS